MEEPVFFDTAAAFRSWLERNGSTKPELWVGFHKRDSGRPSMTWPESVDQALCFGWIDGKRKRLDDTSYVIRFTPRRTSSMWSNVNIRRVEELKKLGLMRPEGLLAFENRKGEKSGVYSFEQKDVRLGKELETQFRADKEAWEFFEKQAPWYRRTAAWWVISAKREETKQKRLGVLMECSRKNVPIPALARGDVVK